MVVDLDSAGPAPHVTQPLMLDSGVCALSVRDAAKRTSMCRPRQASNLTGAMVRE